VVAVVAVRLLQRQEEVVEAEEQVKVAVAMVLQVQVQQTLIMIPTLGLMVGLRLAETALEAVVAAQAQTVQPTVEQLVALAVLVMMFLHLLEVQHS
jgi:diacylglycerol kinase